MSFFYFILASCKIGLNKPIELKCCFTAVDINGIVENAVIIYLPSSFSEPVLISLFC